jgi:RNA 2',3'-cyclic 3'-phosphodiesterase
LRLFFALWPDVETTRQFAAAASALKLQSGGRLVRPGNHHLTLAFVGEVPDARLAMLRQIGRSMLASRFALLCDGIEYWAASRVVVAAVRETPAPLLDLWARLNEAIGLPLVALRAHVTLARKVAQASVLPAMSPILWRANHFSLVQSETGGAESAYTVVDTWQLLDER